MADQPDLAYQMEVYFERFPELDLAAVDKYLNGCEPGWSDIAWEVRAVGDDTPPVEPPALRVGAFAAFINDSSVAVLVHDTPADIADLVQSSGLRADHQAAFRANRAWALLTQIGGEDEYVERILSLYAVATALCQQGALGVLNLMTNRLLPAGVLLDLFGEPATKERNFWQLLRSEAEPAQLLANMGLLEIQGRRYLATRGYGHCGLTDFIWEATDQETAREVADLFKNALGYLIQRGPVIRPGHTMGYDANAAFRFSACPPELVLPYPTGEVLLVTRESSEANA